MQSIAKKIAVLAGFPVFTGAGTYMHKTRMDNLVLPRELTDYVPVLDTMLSSLKDRAAVCYVTIDEKLVQHSTHRRGGAHVDFNWYENLNAHGGHKGLGMHGNTGGHGAPLPQRGGHGSPSIGRWNTPTPSPGHGNGGGTHGQLYDELNGGMLLTSNYPACQVWRGELSGPIGEGGCCKDIDLSGLEGEIMPANEVYYLNPLGIHESLPIHDSVQRQLVRINFHPNYIPQLV